MSADLKPLLLINNELLCSFTAAEAKIAALEAELELQKHLRSEDEDSFREGIEKTVAERDAAVARVAELRQAAQAVITAYDKACLEKYDEQCWDAFAGVDPLRAAIGSASSAAGEAT